MAPSLRHIPLPHHNRMCVSKRGTLFKGAGGASTTAYALAAHEQPDLSSSAAWRTFDGRPLPHGEVLAEELDLVPSVAYVSGRYCGRVGQQCGAGVWGMQMAPVHAW